jgi:hypothetical protein
MVPQRRGLVHDNKRNTYHADDEKDQKDPYARLNERPA